MIRLTLLTTALLFINSLFCLGGNGPVLSLNVSEPGDLYVITVGINQYFGPHRSSENCVNDSKLPESHIQQSYSKISFEHKQQIRAWWAQKTAADTLQTPQRHSTQTRRQLLLFLDSLGVTNADYRDFMTTGIENVVSYVLLNEYATKKNIIANFKQVIRLAKPQDYFIFHFAGISFEDSNSNTYLSTYFVPDSSVLAPSKEARLYLNELAPLMEQIECFRQLFISEAGDGESFAYSLISELIEVDPLKSFGVERDRVIITTNGVGYDNINCGEGYRNNGPLMHYLIEDGLLLDAFFDFERYKRRIHEIEAECPVRRNLAYTALYRESDYRKVFERYINAHMHKGLSRGGKTKFSGKKTKAVDPSKTYALVVATNDYEQYSGWANLKNPINDANSISSLLEKKIRC